MLFISDMQCTLGGKEVNTLLSLIGHPLELFEDYRYADSQDFL